MEPIDLKKLRESIVPYESIKLTPEQLQQRKRPAVTVRAVKVFAPPKGKGGEQWQKFFARAQADGHQNPERFADSYLRMIESNQAIEAKRHRLQKTDKVLKACETAHVEKRTALPPGVRCKATLMNGKQCEFKKSPGCGDFCAKHKICA
jgi:hypothetical protein